jgi:hypothetical protein
MIFAILALLGVPPWLCAMAGPEQALADLSCAPAGPSPSWPWLAFAVSIWASIALVMENTPRC